MRDRRLRRLVLAGVGLVLVALPLLAGPASAADGDSGREGDDTRVVLTGRVDVAEDETVDTVVILDGPAVIAGRADGDVVAFNGNVRVSGTVTGDVIVFKGRAVVVDGGVVEGDVTSSCEPRIEEGGRVEGDVERVNFTNVFRILGWVIWFAWWLAVTISALALGALILGLAPRPSRAVAEVAGTRTGPSFGWGFLVGIGLPIASGLVMITLVGIPLGLVGLLATAPLYAVGYVFGALALGQRVARSAKSPFIAFLAGWGILSVVDLIPVLGNLVTFLAAAFGIGAVVLAAWPAIRDRQPPSPLPGSTEATLS